MFFFLNFGSEYGHPKRAGTGSDPPDPCSDRGRTAAGPLRTTRFEFLQAVPVPVRWLIPLEIPQVMMFIFFLKSNKYYVVPYRTNSNRKLFDYRS